MAVAFTILAVLIIATAAALIIAERDERRARRDRDEAHRNDWGPDGW
jgi:hypothetical protein